MQVILLPTVPHTGTHFMAAFFEAWGKITNRVPLDALARNPCAFRDPDTGHQGLDPNGINLVRGHISGTPGDDVNSVIANLAQHWTPIIPLRDPLATLVSIKARVPEQDCADQLARWVTLVEHIDAHLRPHYITLDLCRDFSGRSLELARASYAAGLNSGTYIIGPIAEWATEWPKDRYNSVGVNVLKAAYALGDLGYLRTHGMEQDIVALQQHEDLLRPWLEMRGYRGLAWWS